MIPHKTSCPSRTAPSAGDGSQSDRSAAVTELENAVAHFQAILTDDERKRLQGLKELPHDAQSIIVFTAELDMQQDGKRRGKSIASRLTSFLQIIQQFTPIIDTYIQSNPDISAIIWSSIKLTFMVYVLGVTNWYLLTDCHLCSFLQIFYPNFNPSLNCYRVSVLCIPDWDTTRFYFKTQSV
jgi:hypothetical protein